MSTLNSEEQLIDIFIPVYKNKLVFEHTLESILKQSHHLFRVHIYDNGKSEGNDEIYDLVKYVNDNRVIYKNNFINIGFKANYNQIISDMKNTEVSMCLPADIGLRSDALEKMLDIMTKYSSSIVFAIGRAIEFDELSRKKKPDKLFFKLNKKMPITQKGIDIISEYYSSLNINGEYNDFSFFGALISSKILHNLGRRFNNFSYHGFEHYLSMELAMNAPIATRIYDELYLAIIGAKRLGDTSRPSDDYTRFEPILACEQFLDNHYPSLIAHYKSLDLFIKEQINKCNYFMANYKGYENEIKKIKNKNIKSITK